ncbi:MAG: EAL domain-containing protein, partial [Pseudomonas sp.]
LAVMHASEALQKTGPTRAKGAPYLSINLTALNFLDTSIGQRLLALPERARRRIVLELTEWKDPRLFAGLPQAIAALQAHGIRVAIDDFGAGYSGLNLLAEFQPDIIKLDMEMVRDIDRDPVRQAIVKGILGVCIALNIEVIAEGIESLAELRLLQSLGINLFQGYLFAKPGFEHLPEINWPTDA